MARAIRSSASSALIVHSEKAFDPRELDEGRMAPPPFGCPSPAGPMGAGSKWFPQISNNRFRRAVFGVPREAKEAARCCHGAAATSFLLRFATFPQSHSKIQSSDQVFRVEYGA